MKDHLPYVLTLRASTLSGLRDQIKNEAMKVLRDAGDDTHFLVGRDDVMYALLRSELGLSWTQEQRVLRELGFPP